MPSHRSPGLSLQGSARCQLAFTAPFAVIGGAMLGVRLSSEAGWSLPLMVVLSVLAMLAFVTAQMALEPVVVAVSGGPDGRWAGFASYLWDMLMGTVLGLPLTTLMDESSLAAVGLALGAGAVYGYVMGVLVCGEGAESLVRLVFEGTGGPARPRHSYALSLAVQGRTREAIEVYRAALAQDPRDGEAHLGLASIQHRFLHDPEGAILTLRSALRQARLTEGHVIVAFQRIAAIRAQQGRPEALAPDLARYLEKNSRGPAADWARTHLARIKSGLLGEGQESEG